MKKLVFFLLTALCTLWGQSSQPTPLFNGKNLDGWTVFGTEKWFVEDGLLVCESGPNKDYGYLKTDKNYKNFILTVEFKPERNGNSGVFIRSDVKGIKVNGWQVEIAPKGTGFVYESYGRGWLVKPNPEMDKFYNPKGWNTLKIKVDGDHITSWVNGHEIINLTDAKIGAGEGGIALQIHSGGGVRVVWKSLMIQELPSTPAPAAKP